MTTIEDVTITGDGAQTAFGNTVSRDLVITQLNFVRGRPSMVLSEGEIRDRVAGYVPALNHDHIVAALRHRNAVALAGPPGAGVTTTAVAALRELRPGLPIRLFSTDEDDMEEISGAPHGYLVRAADEEETRLRACLEAVRASGGFLLVVGTEADQRRFAEFLPAIPVRPPAADAVYRRRLERCGLDGTHWPGWPRAKELLSDASPGDGRRLADLVAATGDEGEAERAYRGWAEQLRGWFAEHPGLRDRTLLVAAATIAPADETSVYGAALSLARQLKIKVEGGGLAWCPSTGLSKLLGADREDDALVFRRHGFADSVLRHVWDDYPLARTDLLSWLSALPTDDVVTLRPELRDKLVGVFADLAADHGYAEKIVQMAERWAGDAYRAADLSYIALARTCLHPLVGGRVRRRLYEWSRVRQAPQTLKLTVVSVCQVLGQTHVTIALTRLKHLATYGNEQVQDEVLDVVRALAEKHPRAVVQAAMDWCRTSVQLASGADAARRARMGLRILLDLPSVDDRHVVAVMEDLALRGGEPVRSVVVEGARELAVRNRGLVLRMALAWAGNADHRPYQAALPCVKLGTALFLELAAEMDANGLALTLTGPGAVPAAAGALPWAVALAVEGSVEGGYDDFPDAAWLWLDTADARPDLRPGVVEVFVTAAGADPMRRALVVDCVRAWRRGRGGSREVEEDVLVRVLDPGWQRLLLRLWVGLRRTLAGG
ncbi:hypothetical protein E1200_14625 [Actinomadura sp. GC306]|uniref:hypothetical protein n=1 Tax=Actinomadura sp. GC306 TaxID=2530367 RepID=UPI001048D9D7|nr:hypothetical protein [Actinomadura sp. GC306]TDC67524.1 hypothetical protein E1200_14625 [Actinomadura sp. GC306]